MSEPANREEAIFSAAAQLPAEQRADYLRQACGGDEALQRRIEALLAAEEKAGGFLEEPASPAGRPTIVLSIPPTEKPGDKIGRYKLLQQIGEGGCGVVYMAEQEEPVRRRVALKVIKLGMDTKSVIARFEAERQALAMMDHPNIAKVLDAGATENGRPYFVMELVRGIKITDYCDQNKLSTEARLGLFVQVCNAIQHAHQKGIIHRDIKPSNILVTLHDGVPVPKVIDFGIAKATQGRLTDRTLFTAFEQFIGTPAYMSPEQAEMSGLDVDTRSDIYALGVLLYELLTSRTPFDAKELLQAGLDELRRTIREKEPARPSTRLSTMLDADLTAVAQRRQSEIPKLIHALRGDLDWIVMKSLEKDRTRRYETANGLAMDIQRYLTNEPVVARPPSTVYKFQKLVRRNKTIFAAVGAGVAALVLGLVLSLYLFVQEKTALKRAVAAEEMERQLHQQSEESARISHQIAQASLLLMRDKPDEAEQIVNPLPTLKSMVALFNYFGLVHARRGEWRQAITNYAKVVKVAPEDPAGYFYLAPLFCQVGDVDEYHGFCSRMLQQFADTTDPQTAADTAGYCLMLPPPESDWPAINRLADTAVAADAPGPRGESTFVKAWAEYRQGHFGEAMRWLKKNVDWIDRDKRTVNNESVVAFAMLQAMTQYKLGQVQEARPTLANGLWLAKDRLPVAGQSSLGDDWNQWILAQILMREAAVLMPEVAAAKTAAPAPGPPEIPSWQIALTNAGWKFTSDKQDDGTWELILDDQPVTNISLLHGAAISRLSLMHTAVSSLEPLRGMPLKKLWLAGTAVTDLAPLQGLRLEYLQISGTAVTNLEPLRGMPLHDLRMSGCTNLVDLAPVIGLTTLQNVILPPNAKNIEPFRQATNLVRISYKYDPSIKAPAQTAADFWDAYDKRQAGKTAAP